MALAVVLMVLCAHWGVRFGTTVVSGAALILLRYFLLPRLSEEGVEPVRRALNIGLSAVLWVSFLLLPTTDWVPQDVFLPGAVMAGMWFLLDQSKGRLLDTLYAGLVALVAIVGIALTPAQGVLALPGALLVGAAPVSELHHRLAFGCGRRLIACGHGSSLQCAGRPRTHILPVAFRSIRPRTPIGKPPAQGLRWYERWIERRGRR